MKKAYFIGIAGKTMASLAKAFKNIGWQVTGSDQEKVYPPVTDYLSENEISYLRGYKKENLPLDADLVVVGRSALLVDADNPEYLEALSLKMNVLSYPEVLNKYLIKENSIVIAGSNAKSTTTALISWIFINAGINPSYMFGGIPFNFEDGTKISDSEYSIVEGDETPSLKETDPPKFMFYKTKYLLLTSTQYDHPEVFKTKNEYLQVFVDLVKSLPKDGIMFYDSTTVDETVVDACSCLKFSFDASDVSLIPDVLFKESALRAKILCLKLNIDEKIIDDSILSFKGLKGRNEFLGKFGGRYLFHDLSQQSSKIKATISLLRKKYLENKIIVVFNPSATSLKFKENIDQYSDSFIDADQILVAKVDFKNDIAGDNRVTGPDLVKAFGGKEKVIYEPVGKNIIEWLNTNSNKEDVIVFMSSGGFEFTKLIEDIKNYLEVETRHAASLPEVMNQKYKEVIEKLGDEKVKRNVSLADYTSFRIGGPADLFYEAESEEELIKVLGAVRDIGIPYFILGGGSNILVSDNGFSGLIIKLSNCELKITENIVLAGAGLPMVVLLDECKKNSLSGLEFMAGVPGTVGGAIRGNARSWQINFGDMVNRVRILTETGEIKWIEQKDCSFGIKDSRFKHNSEIILSAEIGLINGQKEEIENKIYEYLEKRLTQPKEPSAGCIFINPLNQPAGKLIDECGLKGIIIGGAKISEKHANFIVNNGNASAKDVYSLIELMKKTVLEKFSIELTEEIVKIGEFD